MSDLPARTIYHCPASCSRVALNALEEIGLPYREVVVALTRGEQYQPDFLRINNKSKVPVLVEDGRVITELPVILTHLAAEHRSAGLLPPGPEALSDLIWLAGAVHPAAVRLLNPSAYAPDNPDGVKAIGRAMLAGYATIIAERLNEHEWWYGDSWSITDMFIGWIFAFANQVGFPLADYPVIETLVARVEARPSFVRARATEMAAAERDDIQMPPGLKL